MYWERGAPGILHCKNKRLELMSGTLLAFIAHSAFQSSAQTHIHNAIVVIDTSNNASYNQVHWLVGTPYLAVKASNGLEALPSEDTELLGN